MLSAIERTMSSASLSHGSWFANLSPGLRDSILARARLYRYEPRELLYGTFEASPGFWMLLQGQVIVAETFPDGERFLYHIGGPGFCFGGGSLINAGRSGEEAVATTKVQVLLLPATELDRILVEDNDYYRAFAELIMDRHYLVLRCLARSRTLPPEQYLRVRLALLSKLWRQDGFEDPVIELAVSQTEAAGLLGISRQTLNRYLSHLEDEGLVEVCFRTIRILEPEQLCQLANQEIMP